MPCRSLGAWGSILVCGAHFFVARAEAAKVRNLDDRPHTLTVINGGEQSVVHIEPGRFHTSNGPWVTLQLEGSHREIKARSREEYIIYKGTLILQRGNYLNPRS